MGTLNIYFDFTKVGGNVVIGTVAYEKEGVLRHTFKKIEKLTLEESEKYNQFHSTIKALHLGIKELKEWITENKPGGMKVVLLNQNQLIFRWLAEQSYSIDYADVFEELNYDLFKLLDSVEFEYREITGKDNRVKKILKQEAATIKVDSQSLNFSLLREKFSDSKTRVEERENQRKVVGDTNIVDLNRFKV